MRRWIPQQVRNDRRGTNGCYGSFWLPARKIVISAAAVRIAIVAIIFRTTRAANSPENTSRTYRIEISKWEYCDGKNAAELDDYTVYVYTPTMIVFEKLRAICQQMPEYSIFLGKSYETARARDFFDIHTVVEHFNINLTKSENLNLLKVIFKAKEVPVNLIGKIKEFREYHRPDFISVENTVKPNIRIKDFDYYFDYVVKICNKLLEALGEI